MNPHEANRTLVPAGPGQVSTRTAQSDLPFSFCSARQRVYAESPQGTVPNHIFLDPGLVQEALRACGPKGGLAGALGFDRERSSHIGSYARLSVEEGKVDPLTPVGTLPRVLETSSEVPQAGAGYVDMVRQALAEIKAGRIQKVVLSRALNLHLEAEPSLSVLWNRLATQNPAAYRYLVRVGAHPNDAIPASNAANWIGASPELLLAKRGDRVISHPLAGSAARSGDPAQDARAAEKLLQCAKSRREHALVVEALVERLREHCSSIEHEPTPRVVDAGPAMHLGTVIQGKLKDPQLPSLVLAASVHPTPAVCGTPTMEARSVIQELEPTDRELYTGAVGYCLPNGDGEWAVAIRCAKVQQRHMKLYAGGGIVDGSSPQSELDETSYKLQTMLRAFGAGS